MWGGDDDLPQLLHERPRLKDCVRQAAGWGCTVGPSRAADTVATASTAIRSRIDAPMRNAFAGGFVRL